MITPAISVLSAVEGLEVATPALKPYGAADRGDRAAGAVHRAAPRHRRASARCSAPSSRSGSRCSAATGLVRSSQPAGDPAALDPRARLRLPARAAAGALSSRSARSCWPSPAPRRCMPTWATSASGRSARLDRPRLPALALNYMGQGALLMREPGALENPFYRLFAPAWLLPAVVLATLATVIASQAVISGAYSMTQPGDAARLPAAHARGLHLGQRGRADLHARSELGAARRGGARVHRLRQLVGAGLGLRHRRHRHDAHHHRAHLLRRAPRAGAIRCRSRSARPDSSSSSTPCSSPRARSSSGRAAGSRSCSGAAMFAAMPTWQRGRELLLERIAQRRPAARCPSSPRSLPTRHLAAHGAHRGLRRRQCRRRAAGAAAQPEAQPGAARAQRDPDRASSTRSPWIALERARRGRAAGARLLAACSVQLRLQGTRPTSRRRWSCAAATACRSTCSQTSFFLSRETVVPTPARRHGALARIAVRADASQRRPRRGVLPSARQPRHRARHAGADLSVHRPSAGPPDRPSAPRGQRTR